MTKRYAKGGSRAEAEAEVRSEEGPTATDEVMEALGVLEGGPEPDEEEVPEPKEDKPDAVRKEEEQEEAPEEAESTGEAPDDEDDDSEDAAREAAQSLKERTPQKDRDKALRDELTRLRKELRDRKAQEDALKAPSPIQQQPQQQAPPPPPPATGRIPIEFDKETGAAYLPEQQIRAAAEQYVTQSQRPDPIEVAQREFERERDSFVAENPTVHGPAIERCMRAYELLDTLATHYVASTGDQLTGFGHLLKVIDETDIGETFHRHFPEIESIPRFLNDIAFTEGDPSRQNWARRRYMEDYVAGRTADRYSAYAQKEQAAEEQEEVEPSPEPAAAAQESNIVKLPANRPRSMAKKGDRVVKETSDLKRIEKLEEYLLMNPVGSEEEEAELKALCKKLGREYI